MHSKSNENLENEKVMLHYDILFSYWIIRKSQLRAYVVYDTVSRKIRMTLYNWNLKNEIVMVHNDILFSYWIIRTSQLGSHTDYPVSLLHPWLTIVRDCLEDSWHDQLRGHLPIGIFVLIPCSEAYNSENYADQLSLLKM